MQKVMVRRGAGQMASAVEVVQGPSYPQFLAFELGVTGAGILPKVGSKGERHICSYYLPSGVLGETEWSAGFVDSQLASKISIL
jgi:hypothetical protein